MIDINKQYRTRDGKPVRILATDVASTCPVVATIKYLDGEECAYNFSPSGSFMGGEEHHLDLIEVKLVREAWVNIYPPGVCHGYPSREMADRHALVGRIACIKITYSEGEGL